MLRKSSKPYVKREAAKYITLLCEKCHQTQVKVEEHVVAVTCHICCSHMGPQLVATSAKTVEGPKKPKGWRFMKVFVDSDGNVFHKGEEQPTLKGTLPTTVIVPKEKKSTFHKEQEKAEKEAKLAKKFAKKQEKLKKLEEKKEAEKAKEQPN